MSADDAAAELHPKLRAAVEHNRENWKYVRAAVARAENAPKPNYEAFSVKDLAQAVHFAKQGGNLLRVQRITQELARRRIARG